jgi:DNA-binding response OmpR family regulator
MYSMPHNPAVILIIDDDPLTLTGMAATLDMAGYECHCARDAEAATKAARDLRLDLIVCDVLIGDRSGFDVVDALRDEHAANIPVMYVSSVQTPDIIERVHDAGGAYYLRKPIDPDVLIELAGKALWMPHLVHARFERTQANRTRRPGGRRQPGQRSSSQSSTQS